MPSRVPASWLYTKGGEEALVAFLESARATRQAQELYDAETVSELLH